MSGVRSLPAVPPDAGSSIEYAAVALGGAAAVSFFATRFRSAPAGGIHGSMIELTSHVAGRPAPCSGAVRTIVSAVTDEPVARFRDGIDVGAMLDHARRVGGPALAAHGFHDRARMLKALALALDARKGELHALSHTTGATLADARVDVDGGIATLFAYASKGRRELPDSDVWVEGGIEQLSRRGSFVGAHILTSRPGVAVQVNAFNFPVWGMLEKLAPMVLAGMPTVVKPATATAHVAARAFGMIVESGVLPEGAVQLVLGSLGDALDRLGPQDAVAFTGSAAIALKLRSNPSLLARAVPFTAEQDSLNATVLGPDAATGSPEFDLLVREIVSEMTVKAGQKCTAIRRVLVPAERIDAVGQAVAATLAEAVIGDPADEATTMGALVSRSQRDDVRDVVAALEREAVRLTDARDVPDRGAFLAPVLLRCDDPDAARAVHEREAFGPVATLMPYRDADHAAALLARGGGSLVSSVVSHDREFVRGLARAAAPWHGRLHLLDRDAREATPHGAPLPHMIHGGPGRAGGGEELGGVRAVAHYMARTAVQGSPDMIAAVTGTWLPGAETKPAEAHPFTRTFDELALGETLVTQAREVTLEDIETFARFTGDTFYAHMDEAAAAANPFFPGRVAHGYLLLSFAAGLFVQPDPGPVLANTGLSDLAFRKPVSPGDTIRVTLTVKRKARRTDEYGEVRWHVLIANQDDEPVATYTLHTMNSYA